MLCGIDVDVFINFISIIVLIISIVGCHRIYDSKGRKGGAYVGFLFGPLGFVLACLVKPVKRDPRLDGLRVKKSIKYPIESRAPIGVAIVVIIFSFFLLFLLANGKLDNESLLVSIFWVGISMLVAGIVCWVVSVVRQTSRRRADAGNPQCQYNVAVAILKGEGNVFKTLDTSLAIGYLKRSAEQGYRPAIAAIEEIREHGVDVGFVARVRICNAPINPETGASLSDEELKELQSDGSSVFRCLHELTDEDVFCPACGAKTSPAKDPMALVDPMVQVVAPLNKPVPFGVVIGFFLLFGLGWYFNYQKEKKDQEDLARLLNFSKRQADAILNSYKRHSNAMSDLKQFGAAVRICRKNLESDLATDSSVTDEILADPDYKAGMTDESRQTFLPNWTKVCEAVDYNPLDGE